MNCLFMPFAQSIQFIQQLLLGIDYMPRTAQCTEDTVEKSKFQPSWNYILVKRGKQWINIKVNTKQNFIRWWQGLWRKIRWRIFKGVSKEGCYFNVRMMKWYLKKTWRDWEKVSYEDVWRKSIQGREKQIQMSWSRSMPGMFMVARTHVL